MQTGKGSSTLTAYYLTGRLKELLRWGTGAGGRDPVEALVSGGGTSSEPPSADMSYLGAQ